jgi:hypothetical protein
LRVHLPVVEHVPQNLDLPQVFPLASRRSAAAQHSALQMRAFKIGISRAKGLKQLNSRHIFRIKSRQNRFKSFQGKRH